MRFILSDSAQWERNNGVFQGKEFFKHIVKVLCRDSPWSQGVIADWNVHICVGVPLHILTPHCFLRYVYSTAGLRIPCALTASVQPSGLAEIDTLFGQLDKKDDDSPGKYEDEAGNVDAASQ